METLKLVPAITVLAVLVLVAVSIGYDLAVILSYPTKAILAVGPSLFFHALLAQLPRSAIHLEVPPIMVAVAKVDFAVYALAFGRGLCGLLALCQPYAVGILRRGAGLLAALAAAAYPWIVLALRFACAFVLRSRRDTFVDDWTTDTGARQAREEVLVTSRAQTQEQIREFRRLEAVNRATAGRIQRLEAAITSEINSGTASFVARTASCDPTPPRRDRYPGPPSWWFRRPGVVRPGDIPPGAMPTWWKALWYCIDREVIRLDSVIADQQALTAHHAADTETLRMEGVDLTACAIELENRLKELRNPERPAVSRQKTPPARESFRVSCRPLQLWHRPFWRSLLPPRESADSVQSPAVPTVETDGVTVVTESPVLARPESPAMSVDEMEGVQPFDPVTLAVETEAAPEALLEAPCDFDVMEGVEEFSSHLSPVTLAVDMDWEADHLVPATPVAPATLVVPAPLVFEECVADAEPSWATPMLASPVLSAMNSGVGRLSLDDTPVSPQLPNPFLRSWSAQNARHQPVLADNAPAPYMHGAGPVIPQAPAPSPWVPAPAAEPMVLDAPATQTLPVHGAPPLVKVAPVTPQAPAVTTRKATPVVIPVFVSAPATQTQPSPAAPAPAPTRAALVTPQASAAGTRKATPVVIPVFASAPVTKTQLGLPAPPGARAVSAFPPSWAGLSSAPTAARAAAPKKIPVPGQEVQPAPSEQAVVRAAPALPPVAGPSSAPAAARAAAPKETPAAGQKVQPTSALAQQQRLPPLPPPRPLPDQLSEKAKGKLPEVAFLPPPSASNGFVFGPTAPGGGGSKPVESQRGSESGPSSSAPAAKQVAAPAKVAKKAPQVLLPPPRPKKTIARPPSKPPAGQLSILGSAASPSRPLCGSEAPAKVRDDGQPTSTSQSSAPSVPAFAASASGLTVPAPASQPSVVLPATGPSVPAPATRGSQSAASAAWCESSQVPRWTQKQVEDMEEDFRLNQAPDLLSSPPFSLSDAQVSAWQKKHRVSFKRNLSTRTTPQEGDDKPSLDPAGISPTQVVEVVRSVAELVWFDRLPPGADRPSPSVLAKRVAARWKDELSQQLADDP
ncbi:hypothetical protein NKR23_g2607 [Pleurostoma richardsiae]|uniref:Uncharacterized protein n=1 Tax=Pleurostoma richardsiae TaxID=41990 RepID=A0AA38RWH2_9PEZI|nr:hypothetical protein NKR23_g2607 [Pleurostoma richardsiae]